MHHRARPVGLLVRRIVVTLSALAAAGGAALAAPAPDPGAEAFTVAGPVTAKAVKPPRQIPSQRLGVALGVVPLVALSELDNEALMLADEAAPRTKALRYGVGRAITVESLDGAWTALPDGSRLWAAEVDSPNAIGLRLHFADVHLPPGGELAIYSAGDGNGLFTSDALRGQGAEIHQGSPLAASDFWSGTVAGERARLEYLAPAGGADAVAVPFRLDRLQHLYRDPVAELFRAKAAAGPCHNDVTCFPEWSLVARAVSGIGFIGGDALFCTGQLLNISKAADFTPYWLTAHHCLSSPGEAASSEIYWLYQTATCGGPPPSLLSVPHSQGATLLATNTPSDYTLLLIEGKIPAADVAWAGWTSKSVKVGTPATAIHHPSGDFKRISFGFNDNPSSCPANHVRISWTDGPTEPGSSGSGVFRNDTQQLFGQLHGGPSACGNETFDCYGAFATTYKGIKKLLTGGSDDKSEQNDSCKKARLVKPGTLTNRIVKVFDEDWYRLVLKRGQTLDVDLSFLDANGDVDLQVFGGCSGDPVASSLGSSDGEATSVTNVGNGNVTVYWRVFLADDTRNSYDMHVAVH